MSGDGNEADASAAENYTERQLASAFHPTPETNSPPSTSVPQQSSQSNDQQASTDSSSLREPESSSTTAAPNPSLLSTTIRADAPAFSPAPPKVIADVSTAGTASSADGAATAAYSTETMLFDLDQSKYKHEKFIARLSGSFDPNFQKFGSPSGICSAYNNHLLVTNYDLDSVVLFDLNGAVRQLYRQLPGPKDIQMHATNPNQAIVATKKEVVVLDLETSQVVQRSKLRGFYPWNIQNLQATNLISACDPSGEQIFFLNQNLENVGDWSFNERNQQAQSMQQYQKVYPYAARFLTDETAVVLVHRDKTLQLYEKDVRRSGATISVRELPAGTQSYSLYVDRERNVLIPDKPNKSLILFDQGSAVNRYRFKNIQEPYSLTFLSDGTLCVTDWNKSAGTNGGVVVLSERELTANS